MVAKFVVDVYLCIRRISVCRVVEVFSEDVVFILVNMVRCHSPYPFPGSE